MVLYLKYRPQTLSDLYGQDLIVQTLRASLLNDKLSHAYLFVGPRGVGKTSTARILAKMVNCENGGEDNCETCRSITDGSCLDLIEIDAASNRGIDDVRQLREKIKLSPTSLKKKVYIIDEVHMLTNEAWNALLKTLEEPPAHVLFILATTEAQKIPATILSRVTRLDFKGGDGETLEKALKKVVDGEKIDIEEEAVKVLAKKSDGSFRDAIKLLDQLASQNQKITISMVEDSLRGGKMDDQIKMLGFLAVKNTKESLTQINAESTRGTSFKEYILSLMDTIRSLLLIKQGVADLVKASYSDQKFKTLVSLGEKFSVSDLIVMLEKFQEAFEKLKSAGIPSLPLEVAVIECCQDHQLSVISNQTSETLIIDTSPVIPDLIGNLDSPVKPENDKKEKTSFNDVVESTTIPSDQSDMATLQDKWNYILEVIKQSNFSLEAMLRSVKIDSIGEGLLTLRVPYAFHQRILETPRNRDLLEFVLADILGKQIKVATLLDARPVKIEELANVELAADDDVIKLAAEIFNSDSAN